MLSDEIKFNEEILRLVAIYGDKPLVLRNRLKETAYYCSLSYIEKAQLLDGIDEVLLKYIK